MRNILFFFLIKFCLIGFKTNAQIIEIVDFNTNAPIEDVLIFNLDHNESVVTGPDGKASLTIFPESAILVFRHPGYHELTLQKSAIQGEVIQLQERVLRMKDVVVSANKWEQEAAEVPNQVISIASKEIRFTNPQTAADMLSSTGEIYVQKSQAGGGSPKLRGFAANSVLIVVDGIRMNNAIYRSGNLQNVISIDPNSLAGAEVILGPGSVIYGSDALGGVMDFHTKDPKLAFEDQLRVSGSAFTRYASANNEKTMHADLGLGSKKLALYSSFSYSDFDDTESGNRRPDGYPDFGKRNFYVGQNENGNDIVILNEKPDIQIPSGFESWHTVQKLSYKPIKPLLLTYGFYLSNTSDIPRYDRLTETDGNGAFEDAEWYYGPQKWVMNSLTGVLTSHTILFDQAKLITAFQKYEESRNDRGFGDDRLRTRTEEVDVWSINLDMDKQLLHGNLFYGLEFLHNDVTSKAIRVNRTTGEITLPATRYPDGGSKYVSYAAYLNHAWNIDPEWVINIGVRYSYIDLEARMEDQSDLNFPFGKLDVNNSAFNGSLGVIFNPNKNLKTNLSLTTGFRAPNIDDIGKVFDFSNGEVQVPNPGLKPEYSYNAEWGLEAMLSDKIEVGGAIFYTWVDNAMVRRDFTFNGQDSIVFGGELSKVVALVNTGEAEIYGLNAEIEATLGSHWAAEATVTATFGEDKTNDEPLRHTTPVFGQAGIIFQHKKLKTKVYTDFNGPRFRKDIPSSEIDDKPHLYASHITDRSKDGSPGWYTFNVKASYQITKHFQLSGGVENILDQHYRTYSSGISAPGRNYIFTIRGSF